MAKQKRTLTNIRKWAEKMGYEIKDAPIVPWKPRVVVTVSDRLYFELEIRESTIYHSCRGGMQGNPAGLFVTTHEKGNYRTYAWHQRSQREAIEYMERDIKSNS